MAATLGPLGIDAPPALVYVDKGLGASILRAGIRLWDQAHPSPAAAIKLTRHNLSLPDRDAARDRAPGGASDRLDGRARRRAVRPTARRGRSMSPQLWRSWASEIAADVHAFAQAGWAPVFALANVVDGTTAEVFRIRSGDPHPFGWIRVMFNVALCRSLVRRRPVGRRGQRLVAAAPDGRPPTPRRGQVARVERRRARRPGRRVHPPADAGLPRRSAVGRARPPRGVPGPPAGSCERQAGGTLLTSSYLRRRHSLPLFALLSTRAVTRSGERRGAPHPPARLAARPRRGRRTACRLSTPHGRTDGNARTDGAAGRADRGGQEPSPSSCTARRSPR